MLHQLTIFLIAIIKEGNSTIHKQKGNETGAEEQSEIPAISFISSYGVITNALDQDWRR